MSQLEKLVSAIEHGYRTRSLFHFTDRSNRESISKFGILSKAEQEERGIAASNPCGDEESRKSDKIRGIYDDVSLSLARKHQMAFSVRAAGRQPNQIVYAISPRVLLIPGTRIALGMANANATEIISAEEGAHKIDIEALYTNHGQPWSSVRETVTRNQKFEILVPKVVPRDLLLGYWSLG